MPYLYISDNGSILGIAGGKFVVKYNGKVIKEIPQKTVDAIYIIGNSTITTPCIHYLLSNNIPTCFFSMRGKYYGRLESVNSKNINLEQQQIECFKKNSFALELSKKVIEAKIHNQIVVAKRYNADIKDVTDDIEQMRKLKVKMSRAKDILELMGYEGIGARLYFNALSNSIKSEYKFYGRNTRPPKDPFNSMISFGYTVIFNEILSVLQNIGMNPYYGFMHKSRNNFPALVSDLLEEWRSVIVDATTLSMINGGEVTLDDFSVNNIDGSIYLSNDLIKKYIKKIENKLTRPVKYLKYDEKEHSFREIFYIQCSRLKKCIYENTTDYYEPILIR